MDGVGNSYPLVRERALGWLPRNGYLVFSKVLYHEI